MIRKYNTKGFMLQDWDQEHWCVVIAKDVDVAANRFCCLLDHECGGDGGWVKALKEAAESEEYGIINVHKRIPELDWLFPAIWDGKIPIPPPFDMIAAAIPGRGDEGMLYVCETAAQLKSHLKDHQPETKAGG